MTILNLSKLLAGLKLKEFDFAANASLLARYIQSVREDCPDWIAETNLEMTKL